MLARNSPLTSPTLMRPLYYLRSSLIVVNPSEIKSIDVNYIKKPTTVQWSGFNVDGTFLYNSTDSINFELHASEEPNLVLNILKLAAISMKDTNLYQMSKAGTLGDHQYYWDVTGGYKPEEHGKYGWGVVGTNKSKTGQTKWDEAYYPELG